MLKNIYIIIAAVLFLLICTQTLIAQQSFYIPSSQGGLVIDLLLHDLRTAETLEMKQVVIVFYFISLHGGGYGFTG